MIIGIDASRANVAEKTGTEWYSWHLIRELIPLLAGHTVRLYSREPLRAGLDRFGADVQSRVLAWPPGILWSHLRLSWELFWHRPDVLFVPADTVPLIHPKKTLTTIHDVAFERWPELYQGRSVQRRLGWLRPLVHLAVRLFTLGRYSASERDYHRWSARHALRSSPRILTVSEFSKREILATIGGQPDQIIVTPLGVDATTPMKHCTPREIEETQRRYGLSRPYVIFIGRLEEKKNIRLLLESFALYHQSEKDPVDLVLLGAPGYGWEAASAAIPTDQRSAIHQLGWVGEDDRWRLHAGARGLIFLSAYEGFGLPPLESMLLRVPVLASRFGSLPEVLDDAALYADELEPRLVAKAINRLVTDQALRVQLSSKGFAWAQQYTWQRTARLTWEAFQQLEPGLARRG